MNNLPKSVVLAVTTIVISNIVQAQIPVTVTTDLPAIINQVQTMGQWAEQLLRMNKQFNQLKQTHNAMQGIRGMAQIANNPLSRKYLPSDYQSTLSLMNKTSSAANSVNSAANYGSLSSKMNALKRAAKLLDDDQLKGIGQNSNPAKLLASQQNQNATNRAIAETGYEQTSERTSNIQTLMDKVDDAPDAKDIADLSARIQAENAMLANEQSKLQTTAHLAAAQDQILNQQRSEISIRASQGEAPRF